MRERDYGKSLAEGSFNLLGTHHRVSEAWSSLRDKSKVGR